MDLEGVVLVAHHEIEGARLLMRYPPLKRNAVAKETLSAFHHEPRPSSSSGSSAAAPAPTPSASPASSAVDGQQQQTPSTGQESKWEYHSKAPEQTPQDAQDAAPALVATPAAASGAATAAEAEEAFLPINSRQQRLMRLAVTRDHTPAYDLASVKLAPALLPRRGLCDTNFELCLDGTSFLGFPIRLHGSCKHQGHQAHQGSGHPRSMSNSGGLQQQQQQQSGGTGTAAVSMVNVVFVATRGAEVHRGLKKALQKVSVDLAMALKHEEERSGWVGSEVSKMLRARDMWLAAQDKHPPPDMFDLTEYLLHISPLCSALKDIYHRLRLSGSAQILLHSWTCLSVSIWPAPVVERMIHPATARLRPYHALLLTDHDLCPLALRCGPAMRALLTHARPSKSFRDIQLETGLSLRQIYTLAAHLVNWRCALVTEVVAGDAVFVVPPRPLVPIFTSPDSLASKFGRDCPASATMLQSLITRFTTQCQTLGKHLDEALGSQAGTSAESAQKRREFVQAVCWMLSHGLLIRLHRHVYSGVLSEEQEQEYLRAAEERSTSPEDLSIFKRLLPLAKEGLTVDEIKWRTNVNGERLERVLQQHRHALLQVFHDAPTASQMCC